MNCVTTTLALLLVAGLAAGPAGAAAGTPGATPVLTEPAPHFEAAPGRSAIGEAHVALVPGHRVLVAPGSVCVAPENGAASDVIRFELLGADLAAVATPEESLPSVSHYLGGSDPAAWRRDVAHHSILRYASVLPGVDVVHRIADGRVRTDFVLAPGADPTLIRLQVHGGQGVRLDESTGDLVVTSTGGDVRYSAPRTFQRVAGADLPVESRFVRRGARRFRVRVGEHDRSRPLVIDPTVEYSSFVQSPPGMVGPFMTVDAAGCLAIATQSFAADFPTTPGAYKTDTACARSHAVRKLSPDGTQVVWSTYLGGAPGGADACDGMQFEGLAGSPDGAIWLVGAAWDPDLAQVAPIQPPTFNLPNGSTTDAYVCRLSADGSALEFASYLGGPNVDRFGGVAVDDAGNALIVGYTEGGFQPMVASLQPTPWPADFGYWLVALSISGADLTVRYSTYVGGINSSPLGLVAADSRGALLVTGTAANGHIPIVDAPIGWDHVSPPEATNGFLVRIAPDGQSIEKAFFIGNTGWNWTSRAVVDRGPAGFVLLGSWGGATLPLIDPPPWSIAPAGVDLGLIAFWPDAEVAWSGRLGGAGWEEPQSLAVAPDGGLVFCGYTDSADLPVVAAHQPAKAAGADDGFVGSVSADGRQLEWLTYLGGGVPMGPGFGAEAKDMSNLVRVDPVTGATWVQSIVGSRDFPTSPDADIPDHPSQPNGLGFYPPALAITKLSGPVRPNLREPSAIDVRPLVRPLRTGRGPAGRLVLGWEETMGGVGFNVNVGRIQSLRNRRAYDHRPVSNETCNLDVSRADIEMPAEDSYFIVTAVRKDPIRGDQESSFGRDSFGNERPGVPPADQCP